MFRCSHQKDTQRLKHFSNLYLEIPAEHIDPTSIDLTALVNMLINASQPGDITLYIPYTDELKHLF